MASFRPVSGFLFLGLLEELEEGRVFHEVGFFDLLLVANGEENGEFRDVGVAGGAMIEISAASVATGRDVGLFLDFDEVLDVVIGVVDGFIVADHHWQSVELLFRQGHLAGAGLAPIVVKNGLDFA